MELERLQKSTFLIFFSFFFKKRFYAVAGSAENPISTFFRVIVVRQDLVFSMCVLFGLQNGHDHSKLIADYCFWQSALNLAQLRDGASCIYRNLTNICLRSKCIP